MNILVERVGAYIKSFCSRQDLGEFEPPQSQCKPLDLSLLAGGADPLDLPRSRETNRAELHLAMLREEGRNGIF